MRPVAPITLLVTLFLTTAIASVAASGYAPGPIVGTPITTGFAPSLVGTQITALLRFTYPDGTPVTVTQTTVTLRICITGTTKCATVTATLISTGLGTYSYSFTAPTGLTGSLTIILPAGSLTDEYGKPFPTADTVIGTFTDKPASSAPALAASSVKSSKGTSEMRITQPLELASQPQINTLLPALLTLLSILGVALVALPKKG